MVVQVDGKKSMPFCFCYMLSLGERQSVSNSVRGWQAAQIEVHILRKSNTESYRPTTHRVANEVKYYPGLDI